MTEEQQREQAIANWQRGRGRALFPLPYMSPEWTRADSQLLVATFCVVLFTAQRLTGYMGLWLYQRLAYQHLVLAAHVVGGAGLVVALTLGARETPMRARTLPVLRVVANHGWSVGSFFVGWLWWMCWPGLRPDTTTGWLLAAAVWFGGMLVVLRRAENWLAVQPHAVWWRIGLPVLLWQAYSLHWELALNFLKDDATVQRGAVQWEQIAADFVGTAVGLAWAGWAARARRDDGDRGQNVSTEV